MEILKKALMKLVSFGENLEGSLKDHKVSFLEAANLSGTLAIAIFYVVQNFQELAEEVKKLDDKRREELLEWFKEMVDMDNDRIERIFEDTLDLILHTCKYIQAYKK